MASDVKSCVQFLIDGDQGSDRTWHIAQVAFKARHVLRYFILGASLVGDSEEFHHPHGVCESLKVGFACFVNSRSSRLHVSA